MSKKVILSCDICGSRNYSVPAQSNKSTDRLSLKKFCSHCNKHTMHKQTA
ncbi:50S ribosomal protein L33 [Sporosarcina beigongshangi]|nr:50S ribosomal protein L33 [Sporosarcina beigongshangi]